MRGRRLHLFFLKELCELYRREKRWLIILPEVKRNLPPPDVEYAVEQHLEQTAERVIRLEELLALIVASDRSSLRTVGPLLKEADNVLAAVTLSSLRIGGAAGRRRGTRPTTRRVWTVGGQN